MTSEGLDTIEYTSYLIVMKFKPQGLVARIEKDSNSRRRSRQKLRFSIIQNLYQCAHCILVDRESLKEALSFSLWEADVSYKGNK